MMGNKKPKDINQSLLRKFFDSGEKPAEWFDQQVLKLREQKAYPKEVETLQLLR